MDLHASATTAAKIFVQDMGPDGLLSKSATMAIRREEAGKTTTFDGQWKKAKSTEADVHEDLHRCGRALREDAGAADHAGEERQENRLLKTVPRRCRGAAAWLHYQLPQLGAWLSGRASPSHGGGQWFESTSAHQLSQSTVTAPNRGRCCVQALSRRVFGRIGSVTISGPMPKPLPRHIALMVLLVSGGGAVLFAQRSTARSSSSRARRSVRRPSRPATRRPAATDSRWTASRARR